MGMSMTADQVGVSNEIAQKRRKVEVERARYITRQAEKHRSIRKAKNKQAAQSRRKNRR